MNDTPTALARLLAQMTRFSCLGSPELAAQICQSLDDLAHLPEGQLPTCIRHSLPLLREEWTILHAAIADETPSHRLVATLH